MSSETINLSKTTNATPKPKLTDEQRAELKAKVSRVLERGLLADRLDVPLPDDMYGEWVHDDPSEVDRLSSMGFIRDEKYSKDSSLHGHGKVGDVIFMTASREVKDLIDETRSELYNRTHGKYNKKEESEYSALIEQQGTPVYNKSTMQVLDGNSLKTTIEGK